MGLDFGIYRIKHGESPDNWNEVNELYYGRKAWFIATELGAVNNECDPVQLSAKQITDLQTKMLPAVLLLKDAANYEWTENQEDKACYEKFVDYYESLNGTPPQLGYSWEAARWQDFLDNCGNILQAFKDGYEVWAMASY